MPKLLVVAIASLALLAAPAGAATPTLTGTVGPGFTITLTLGGKKVATLKRGTYRLVVRDKSSSHDFRLKGPGFNKQFTSLSFVGTRTFTIVLKAGAWSYVCTPHVSSMRATFRVT
ncbi:MAG: hypothetical protein WD689_05445 [Gaiellaceae bacterium]